MAIVSSMPFGFDVRGRGLNTTIVFHRGKEGAEKARAAPLQGFSCQRGGDGSRKRFNDLFEAKPPTVQMDLRIGQNHGLRMRISNGLASCLFQGLRDDRNIQ
jgi:hypothetical protein